MALRMPSGATLRNRIVLRMLGRDIALTDLTTISAIRIVVEAVVEEFLLLYAGLVDGMRRWFIQTATGADLDRRLADFDLVRPAAARASGTLNVSVSADNTLIPAGTAVETAPSDGTDAKRYSVVANPDRADGAWEIDQPGGTVRIAAESGGAAGNTPAGTITFVRTGLAAVTAITNPTPLINGRDAADDDAFREYFRAYLASLTRGTRDAMAFAIVDFVDEATATRPVHSCALVEWGGATLLNIAGDRTVALVVYIEDGTGSASPALVQQIQALVDGDDSEGSGLRAAGIPTEVRAAAALPVDVSVSIDADRGFNPIAVSQAVEHAVREYVARLPVGGQLVTGALQGQLAFAQMFRRVMNVPGVLRAAFDAPTDDVAVPIGRKAMPATVQVAVQVAN